MELLFEILFGIFFELPMEAAMEIKRLKTWVKTTVFLVMANLVDILFILVIRTCWYDRQDLFGAILLSGITLAWIVFTVWGAITGHKRHWKQNT